MGIVMVLVTTGRTQSPFCHGSLFVVFFETKQERLMTSLVAVVVAAREGFITDHQDDKIQLDVILVVCDRNRVLLRSSTYARVMSGVRVG